MAPARALQQLPAPSRLYLPQLLLHVPAAPGAPPAGRAWPDDAVATLILTDLATLGARSGLAPGDAELVRLRERILALAAHEAVAGRVVWDLRAQTDGRVAAAFGAWTQNTEPDRSTARANALALALQAWIGQARATRFPRLRAILLVGDDRILPHLRLRIDAPFGHLDDGWVSETAYFQENTLAADSGIGMALAEDMTLTDDVYGAAEPVTWGPQDLALYLPELAVGRLVERPGDIRAAIDTFLAADGSLSIARSLTACYDFMRDACVASDQLLEDAGLPAAARHSLVRNDWTVDDLRAGLRGDFDLFFYGVHAKHYVHETPHNGLFYAGELAQLLGTRKHGRLAYGLACHAGLNAPGEHPQSVDFPEVFTAAGVHYVASTGWAYGFDGQTQYQERLLAGLTGQLVGGRATTLGAAFVEAKQRYYRDSAEIDHLHAKTLAGTVLYGLPMTRVNLAGSPAGN